MQTRQLRLGDVVDDYCPRERRLSNHVVVAMVEDAIKQTRCSTCDFEHPYKDAKVPPRRKKKDAPEALYQQVLDSVLETHTVTAAPTPVAPAPAPTAAAADDPPEPPAAIVRGVLRPNGATTPPAAAATPVHASAPSSSSPSDSSAASSDTPPAEPEEAEGSMYRRNLIRATLPRPAGEVPVRPIPSFTMREAAVARPGKFRHKQRPAGAGGRPPRPNGLPGNQLSGRPGGSRTPQGRPAGKKAFGAGHQPGQHQPGQHGGKNRQGGGGNKRFK